MDRFCINCREARDDELQGWMCARTEYRHPVTGAKVMRSCISERAFNDESEAFCGESGKFFVVRLEVA